MAQEFETGAYRDGQIGKPDYEGYISPLVIKGFGKYMLKHQNQSNGIMRESDNWQKGIPKEAYIKSMIRHQQDLWMEWRGYKSRDGLDEAMYGLMFNIMGFIFETEKERLLLEIADTEKGKEALKEVLKERCTCKGITGIGTCVICGKWGENWK